MPHAFDIVQDLRFAARTLRATPGFSTVAVLTLVLGIGGNVAIFTLLDAALLRPLPYAHADRLVEIDDIYQGRPGGVGMSEFKEWVAGADAFEALALAEFDETVLPATATADAERIVGNRVSDRFFETLGVQPLHGRTFLPGEDQPGRADVVVLSHRLWQRRFGADASIVGRSITLSDKPHLVVGVMPASFYWIDSRNAEFWRPLGHVGTGRMQHQYGALGRLRPGSTVTTAQAQMTVFAQRAEAQYPDAKGWTIRVLPLGQEMRAQARTPLLLLATAVGLVLLIACANVANLMVIRTVSRRREIAIRSALGASRMRLARELLSESAVLSGSSAALGFLVAYWMLRALWSLLPAANALPQGAVIDAHALAFSAALAVVTTAVFGLIPARRAFGVDIADVVKSHSTDRTGGRIGRRLLANVAGGEIALATVLLVTATLLIVSLAQLFARDMGFQTDRMLTFSLRLPSSRYSKPQQAAFQRELLARLNALPGVESAALTTDLPMGGSYSGSGFEIEGRPTPAEWRQQSAQNIAVTAGYFRTMRMRVVRGRELQEDEREPVIIISDSLARRHWANEDPVGRRIRYRGSGTWLTIAGVVSDTRYGGPAREPNPTIYHPLPAYPVAFVVARLGTTPAAILPSIRGVVRQMDSALPLTRVAMLDDLIGRSVTLERALAWLLGVFAALAVALSSIGVYGVLAYSVERRRHEMGVRLALGADASQLRNMVLLEGGRVAAAGIAIGIAAALGLTRFIAAYLFGVTARDPMVFAVVPVVLAAVAVASVWLPARRAARVDPIVALRVD